MKPLLARAAIVLTLMSCSAQQEKKGAQEKRVDTLVALEQPDWVNFDYHRAKAYVTSSAFVRGKIVVEGKLLPEVWDTAGVSLSQNQVQRLNQILTQPSLKDTYEVADCFYPRHGIVFWDKANQPVAHL